MNVFVPKYITGSLEKFVYLNKYDPSIQVDIKYATKDNFTGEIVRGYHNNIAIITLQAAKKLRKIQNKMVLFNYGLKIFDAYRPIKSVNHFMKWGSVEDCINTKLKYYPNLSKKDLFSHKYIALNYSSHSRGSTVDLTIIYLDTKKELEMGTIFDFFGELSHTFSEDVSEEIYKNRKFLHDIMKSEGFENLPNEWWHYTLKKEPYKDKYFDFDVKEHSESTLKVDCCNE